MIKHSAELTANFYKIFKMFDISFALDIRCAFEYQTTLAEFHQLKF